MIGAQHDGFKTTRLFNPLPALPRLVDPGNFVTAGLALSV